MGRPARETPNGLAECASPYLQSAKHQPVDWLPWGDEAFERARREGKPILLDIGAVWCHWCHVIDRESYEDPEIAAIINEQFVPVKVDRDERPDIDSRMQAAVSAITGQGGWPLTAFLTPEGKVFYGGTYFPPEDRWGRPGMKTLLPAIARAFRERRAEVEAGADRLLAGLAQVEPAIPQEGELHPGLVADIAGSALAAFDPEHGGFGEAPKFFHASALELALQLAVEAGDGEMGRLVTMTLRAMALGGVRDQLEGRFHRYSTDREWRVPHFETMLYDNAELLRVYLHAYQAFGEALFREMALGIIAFVNDFLSDRERGGFFASQDADFSLEDDGDYFTWTVEEVREALPPDEAEVILRHYDVDVVGEMREDPRRNVLWVAQPPETIAKITGRTPEEVVSLLERGKAHLLEARRRRPAPFIDRTLYVSWNGLMAAAYLQAYRALGLEAERDFALRTLDLLWGRAYREGEGMAHVVREGKAEVFGLLDDHAEMARALLLAAEVTGETRYLDRARTLLDHSLRTCWDPEGGGFFDRPNGSEDRGPLALRRKPVQDAPTLAGNAVAAWALDRLADLTGEEAYRRRAGETLAAIGGSARSHGLFAATFALALDNHLRHPLQVIVLGAKEDASARRLWEAAQRPYRPNKIVLTAELLTAARGTLGQGPCALICSGDACAPPARTPEEVEEQVRTFGKDGVPREQPR